MDGLCSEMGQNILRNAEFADGLEHYTVVSGAVDVIAADAIACGGEDVVADDVGLGVEAVDASAQGGANADGGAAAAVGNNSNNSDSDRDSSADTAAGGDGGAVARIVDGALAQQPDIGFLLGDTVHARVCCQMGAAGFSFLKIVAVDAEVTEEVIATRFCTGSGRKEELVVSCKVPRDSRISLRCVHKAARPA